MIARFCLYSIFKNLRFADPFLLLFFLHLEYNFLEIGSVLGIQHLITGALEVPLGVVADRWGRRRSLATGFLCYALSFWLFARLEPGQNELMLFAAVIYGLAEALRSGSHKAIMLDYLDQRGEGERATEVIGFVRSFSKSASAISALTGGLMLWRYPGYALLFWLSIGPALAGFALMLSYPRSLDGEMQRGEKFALGRTRRSQGERIKRRVLFGKAALLPLVLESVLFESQVKIILKYYLQPFLKQGLSALGFPILGMGALAIGVIEFLRDQVGALGAFYSARVAEAMGGPDRVLRLDYLAVIAMALGIGIAAMFQCLPLGVAMLFGITALQNLRRPVFLAAFNQVLEKRYRAASLSTESLARTLIVAMLLPISGWVADRVGVAYVFMGVVSVLIVGRISVAFFLERRGLN